MAKKKAKLKEGRNGVDLAIAMTQQSDDPKKYAAGSKYSNQTGSRRALPVQVQSRKTGEVNVYASEDMDDINTYTGNTQKIASGSPEGKWAVGQPGTLKSDYGKRMDRAKRAVAKTTK